MNETLVSQQRRLTPNKLLPDLVVSLKLRNSCMEMVLLKCLAMIFRQVEPQSLESGCL